MRGRTAVRCLAIAVALSGGAMMAAPDTSSSPLASDAPSANQAPRLTNVKARIGRVYEEGRGYRRGGLQLRFRLCDDGPQNVGGGRFARLVLVHRWRDANSRRHVKRERFPLITYDIYFAERECVGKIPFSSLVPTELRSYDCYSVSVRVRDPAGKWSNRVRRNVGRCAS